MRLDMEQKEIGQISAQRQQAIARHYQDKVCRGSGALIVSRFLRWL